MIFKSICSGSVMSLIQIFKVICMTMNFIGITNPSATTKFVMEVIMGSGSASCLPVVPSNMCFGTKDNPEFTQIITNTCALVINHNEHGKYICMVICTIYPLFMVLMGKGHMTHNQSLMQAFMNVTKGLLGKVLLNSVLLMRVMPVQLIIVVINQLNLIPGGPFVVEAAKRVMESTIAQGFMDILEKFCYSLPDKKQSHEARCMSMNERK